MDLTSDRASVFMGYETTFFFRKYIVHHRVSRVANTHGNSGSKLGVKILKRILRDYVGGFGFLDNDHITQAS